MMLRSSIVASIVAVSLLIAATLIGWTERAAGAGTLDQSFTGNPDCTNNTFKSGVGVIGPLQQEFVPSMPTLTGVDVCVVIHAPETDPALDINIRLGTAEAIGAIVTSTSVDGSASQYQWIHAEFEPLSVAPGEKLLLEVSGRFAWMMTCTEINTVCDHIDSDQYPPGENIYDGADFLFRSYGSNEPGSAPGPPPLTTQWGNIDCSAAYASPVDALILLAGAAGVDPPALPAGSDCPAVGDSVTVFGRERAWGDVDCLASGPVADALALLTNLAAWFITYPRDVACPIAIQFVNVRPQRLDHRRVQALPHLVVGEAVDFEELFAGGGAALKGDGGRRDGQ